MSIEQDFLNSALSAGIEFSDSIIADGNLHRSHIKGHKRGTKNGAYVIFLNNGYAGGWGMDHKSANEFTWSSGKNSFPLSLAKQHEIEVSKIQRDSEIAQKQANAAVRSQGIWECAVSASSNHPYLLRKNVAPHGARTGHSASSLNNVLIIPVFSPNLEIVNLQFIQADGNKKFLSGGRKKGCFWWIGEESDTILIAEGFATAASIYEHMNKRCYIAFDTGNMQSVALTVRKLHPGSDIIIAGDHDKSGVGQHAACNAAITVRGRYIIPPLVDMDWNDYLSVNPMMKNIQ